MSDRSAGALVEALLGDSSPRAIDSLAQRLADDPPLALWTVCSAKRDRSSAFHSLGEMAQWLTAHALCLLNTEPPSSHDDHPAADPKAPWRGEPDAFADQVAHSIRTADLAALLACDHGEEVAEEAYLLGLLDKPLRWFTLASGKSLKSEGNALPEWLAQVSQRPAAPFVAQAGAALADGVPPTEIAFDPQEAEDRARQTRRDWLASVPGVPDLLPLALARLARGEALEKRFQETLEAEKVEALAEFAAGSGHEINNPLAIIGGRAQMLLDDEDDPQRRRELAVIVAQVKRSHEMIADLRLFSRPPPIEAESFDLVAFVDALVARYSGQMSDRTTSLKRSGESGPIEIEADPVQLNVALGAFLRNSLEAIARDGRVEIQLAATPDDVTIRIIDNGPGILPEQRRHLFDPFYSARQAGRGLGFGLSKAWRIITDHGGRIEVQSEPGQGAVFIVRLPRKAVAT